MLSRGKYDQIADIIDTCKGKPNAGQEIARAIAGVFEHSDATFNRQRFLDICDVADYSEVDHH